MHLHFQNTELPRMHLRSIFIRKASSIIDGMFALCAKSIKTGQKDSLLQTILMTYAMESAMFDTGYASTLNPLIIADAQKGALPHAQVSDGQFKIERSFIVVNLTLRYKGYVSDATRTFSACIIDAAT